MRIRNTRKGQAFIANEMAQEMLQVKRAHAYLFTRA